MNLWRKLFPVRVEYREPSNPLAGVVASNGKVFIITKGGKLMVVKEDITREQIVVEVVAHLSLYP